MFTRVGNIFSDAISAPFKWSVQCHWHLWNLYSRCTDNNDGKELKEYKDGVERLMRRLIDDERFCQANVILDEICWI